MPRKLIPMFIALAVLAGSTGATPFADRREAVEELVAPLVDAEYCVGLAVALIDGEETLYVTRGRLDRDAESPVEKTTIFEIGSITQTFTSLLLALEVERGDLAFDTPVKDLLPKGKRVPEFGDTRISLIDLATHTSALPRLPDNLTPADPADPYATYTADDLYVFLSYWGISEVPGTHYEYSNLGAGLLGHALGVHAGRSYEELVEDEICKPLGMADTRIKVPDEERGRFSHPYNADAGEVSYWHFDALAGAAALRSTAADLVTYLRAQMGIDDTPMIEAMKETQKVRHPTTVPGISVALGWHVLDDGTRTQSGGTGGFATYVGFHPDKRIGVVVLGNSAASQLHELGPDLMKLLRGEPYDPIEVPAVVELAPETLDRYVGRYQVFPGFEIKVTREGDGLVAQATNQPPYRIYPSSEVEFYYRVVPARLTFVMEEGDGIQRLILHQGGRDVPAPRVIE